jgi:hypothetical protein
MPHSFHGIGQLVNGNFVGNQTSCGNIRPAALDPVNDCLLSIKVSVYRFRREE